MKTLLWLIRFKNYLKSNDESFTKQPNSEGKLAILFNDMLRSARDFPKESSLETKGKRQKINVVKKTLSFGKQSFGELIAK